MKITGLTVDDLADVEEPVKRAPEEAALDEAAKFFRRGFYRAALEVLIDLVNNTASARGIRATADID